MKKVASLFLSTLSSIQPPYSKANLANCIWNIDFDNIFGDATGNCLVSCRLISRKLGENVWDTGLGTVRANFNSNNSNKYNGIVLGLTSNMSIYDGAWNNCLLSDTLSTKGISILIPKGKHDLNIQIYDMTDTLLSVAVDYEVSLFFEYE